MKRVISLAATASIVSAGGAYALVEGATTASAHRASAAGGLPTLKVTLRGVKGVKVSGSRVSGAVKVVSTFKGKVPKGSHGPGFGLVRLHRGASVRQALSAVQRQHGELNALTPYGSLFATAGAPGTIETRLTPGNYVAVNETGNKPAIAPFTVSKSSSPAKLPKATSTQTAIEFGFKGSRKLKDGTLIRAQNAGYLVHMIVFSGVPSKRDGRRVMALLRAGHDGKARKFSTRSFFSLLNPASPGAMQQMVLRAKPGYYVEACYMDTVDGREHTQLGMERLVKVVK